MTIQCQDLTELAIITAQLSREGVTFTAETSNMLITLTGGY